MGQSMTFEEMDIINHAPQEETKTGGMCSGPSCYGHYETGEEGGGWIENINSADLASELDRFDHESKQSRGIHIFKFVPPDNGASMQSKPIYLSSHVHKDKHGFLDVAYARYEKGENLLKKVYEFSTPHAVKAAVELLLRKGYDFNEIKQK